MSGTSGVSKYISLNKLIAIRDNNYRGTGKSPKDYDAKEVDDLISAKQGKLSDAANDSEISAQDEYSEHLRSLSLEEMNLSEYEDFYYLEHGRLPYNESEDIGFKRAVHQTAINSSNKRPKRSLYNDTPELTEEPEDTSEELPPVPSDLEHIESIADLMTSARLVRDYDRFYRLRSEIRPLIRKRIHELQFDWSIWGDMPRITEEVERLRVVMESITGQRISTTREGNTISLYLSQGYREFAQIECPVDWVRETASAALGRRFSDWWTPQRAGFEGFCHGVFRFSEYDDEGHFLFLETDISQQQLEEVAA